MLSDAHLLFLQQKIEDIQSALFFSMTDSVLKIPNNIVTALKVDEVGQIWFLLNRPSQSIQEFDKEFPVRLNFFRKGKPFYLTITGKAFILTDPEELNSLISVAEDIKQKALDQLILVKVRIEHVEYVESRLRKNYAWVKMLGSRIYKMLFNAGSGYRPYKLERMAF